MEPMETFLCAALDPEFSQWTPGKQRDYLLRQAALLMQQCLNASTFHKRHPIIEGMYFEGGNLYVKVSQVDPATVEFQQPAAA